MYTLTLTSSERKAIDWVGNRYRHGNELYKLLCYSCIAFPDDVDWDDNRDITYRIPENVAWVIAEIIDEGLDCFADELVSKLQEFRDKIV